MAEESYYDILEINRDASFVEIKNKRKELAMKYHPDKLPADKRDWGESMIKKVNEAYEVLSDPEKRELYDKFGKDFQQFGGMGGMGGFNPEDLFGGIFGGKKKQPRQRVEPIQIRIDVTLDDLFNGKVCTQEIERFTLCEDCDNTGFEDKQKHSCMKCKGNGHITEMRQIGPGMIQQMQRQCNKCNGSGSYSDNVNKCKKCNGQSIYKEKHTITINIEPGMCNGDYVEIINEGHPIPKEIQNKQSTQTRGNVNCIINELPHKIFKRGIVFNEQMNPANLSISIELELYEALCGFVKKFKHLDGSDLYIDNYDIIQDGDIKIVEHKGLPYKGNKFRSGDLFIKFKVILPTKFSDTTRNKLYELLTGKKFNNSQVHKIPADNYPVKLKNVEDYHGNNDFNDFNDNDNNNANQEGVQCATQ